MGGCQIHREEEIPEIMDREEWKRRRSKVVGPRNRDGRLLLAHFSIMPYDTCFLLHPRVMSCSELLGEKVYDQLVDLYGAGRLGRRDCVFDIGYVLCNFCHD